MQMSTGRIIDIIPAINYGIDRQAIVDVVLLGEGMTAYSPIQRNVYNDENIEHFDYVPGEGRRDSTVYWM